MEPETAGARLLLSVIERAQNLVAVSDYGTGQRSSAFRRPRCLLPLRLCGQILGVNARIDDTRCPGERLPRSIGSAEGETPKGADRDMGQTCRGCRESEIVADRSRPG
nr:hypothetical protein JVH1_3820 [Rhodococcus sp. JVH1]